MFYIIKCLQTTQFPRVWLLAEAMFALEHLNNRLSPEIEINLEILNSELIEPI